MAAVACDARALVLERLIQARLGRMGSHQRWRVRSSVTDVEMPETPSYTSSSCPVRAEVHVTFHKPSDSLALPL